MKKWIMSVALSVMGILGLCLIPAKNVNADSSDIIEVGRVPLSETKPYLEQGADSAESEPESRGSHYAYFDAANGKLTLNAFNLTMDAEDSYNYCIDFADSDLIIDLIGENNLSITGDKDIARSGIFGFNKGLTIEGNGSIKIQTGDNINATTYGILTNFLTINSGKVSAYGGNTSGESMGAYILGGNYTINGGSFYAEGKRGQEVSVGLTAENININGGKTEAVCDETSPSHLAILGTTNISNGMMITIPKGGTVGETNYQGHPISSVLDGTAVASHVIITSADESDDEAGDGVLDLNNKNSGKACIHDYNWTVEKEPTITEDGELVYKCTKCGHIKARQPLSAEGYCFFTAQNKIKDDKAGQTIEIDLKQWNSIPKSFFEELAKRRDITVKIRFIYKHKNYEMTITPDVQIDLSDETIDYYGPEKLIQLYGAKEVVTK
jgi:hypothetical protein